MTWNRFAVVPEWMENGNANTFVKAHPAADHRLVVTRDARHTPPAGVDRLSSLHGFVTAFSSSLEPLVPSIPIVILHILNRDSWPRWSCARYVRLARL